MPLTYDNARREAQVKATASVVARAARDIVEFTVRLRGYMSELHDWDVMEFVADPANYEGAGGAAEREATIIDYNSRVAMPMSVAELEALYEAIMASAENAGVLAEMGKTLSDYDSANRALTSKNAATISAGLTSYRPTLVVSLPKVQ